MNGHVEGGPRIILKLEGLAVFVLSLFFYAQTDTGWWLFAGLLLAPDIAFLAYLAGPRFGAFGYNSLHTYLGPAGLFGTGVAFQSSLMASLALVWSAHIGMDRMLGYGLKYARNFKATHLGGDTGQPVSSG